MINITIQNMRLKAHGNSRLHWRAKATLVANEKAITRSALLLSSDKPVATPCVVTLTRLGVRLVDDDNLVNLFKSVRDAVATFLGCGDSPTDPIQWRYTQQKSKLYSVNIRIVNINELQESES